VLKGKPVLVPALSHRASYKYRVAADPKRPPGKQTITFAFAYDGGAAIARGLGAAITSAAAYRTDSPGGMLIQGERKLDRRLGAAPCAYFARAACHAGSSTTSN
jgi:hypothetical protein